MAWTFERVTTVIWNILVKLFGLNLRSGGEGQNHNYLVQNSGNANNLTVGEHAQSSNNTSNNIYEVTSNPKSMLEGSAEPISVRPGFASNTTVGACVFNTGNANNMTFGSYASSSGNTSDNLYKVVKDPEATKISGEVQISASSWGGGSRTLRNG